METTFSSSDCVQLAGRLFRIVTEHLFQSAYGADWFAKTLLPHVTALAERGGGETAQKYRALVKGRGAGLTFQAFDITACAAVLLFDEEYQHLIAADADARDTLHALRQGRNDLFHAAESSQRMQHALVLNLMGNMFAAVEQFGLELIAPDFVRALDETPIGAALGGAEAGTGSMSEEIYEGQYQIGLSALERKDFPQARALFEELSGLGYVPAMVALAKLLLSQFNEMSEAKRLLEQAKALGAAEAEGLLGRIKTLGLLQERAAAGDLTAMMQLGVTLEEGALLPRDEEQALEWYAKAAGLGSGMALNRLREMSARGNRSALERLLPAAGRGGGPGAGQAA